MIKKQSPLFLLLLLFSCTNENLITPVEQGVNIESIDPLATKEYPTDCIIPCRTPDYANVELNDNCSLTIEWGYESIFPSCGSYVIFVYDQVSGNQTIYYSPVNSFITPSLPCSDYTIYIGHMTSQCVSLRLEIPFTIDDNNTCCSLHSYCAAEGLNPTCLHSGYIGLTFADRWEMVHTIDYLDLGYVDLSNEVMNVVPGEVVDATILGICSCLNPGGTLYQKLWVDLNQDYIFDFNELLFSNSFTVAAGSGVPNPNPLLDCNSYDLPGFVFPDIEGCGLRARYILTLDPNAGPCSTFQTGQVVDFTINSSFSGC